MNNMQGGTPNQDLSILADFNQPFVPNRLAALDQVVVLMYSGNPQQVSTFKYTNPNNVDFTLIKMKMANELLNQFKQNENAWLCVDQILELS